jgi:quercetin dioxygenase-like cupin family protein
MRTLLAIAILYFSVPAFAAGDQKIDRFTADAYEILNPAELQWADEPSLPKGAKVALFAGKPDAAGVFMAYLKFPANYTIPAHTHPYAELITVLQGRVGNGIGEKFDRDKGDMLEAGSSFTLPANRAHYLWNDEEVVVLLVATGPWNITYTDPKDDPRNK